MSAPVHFLAVFAVAFLGLLDYELLIAGLT